MAMKKLSRGFFILFLFGSATLFSGCPYRLESLSPQYWDDSMRQTTEDVDDVFGARGYN